MRYTKLFSSRFFLCVAVLLVLDGWSGFASAADGYSFLRKSENNRAMQWKRIDVNGKSNFPITIALDDGGSPDIARATIEKIIGDSVSAWSGISCTFPTLLKYAGIIRGRQAPFADRTNVIKFIQNPKDWIWPKGQFAVTIVTSIIRTGEIMDADILLNDWNFKFGSAGGKEADLQATVTHELGHVLGLGHSNDRNATMYFAANVGEIGKRVLKDDDKKGICDLYPRQPCKEGEEKKSEGKVCFNGRWFSISAPYSQACEPCKLDRDCFGAKNFCLPGIDGGRCGHQCSKAEPCESGYSCAVIQDPQKKTIGQNCIPDGKTCQGAPKFPSCRSKDDCLPTYNCTKGVCIRDFICKKNGESCGTTNTCCGGTECVNDGAGPKCREACDPFSPICPRTLRCGMTADKKGFCIPPNGGGDVDDPCNSQSKRCEHGLFCDPKEARCRYLCHSDVAGTCPPSYVCKAVAEAGGGLCYKDGRICKTAADCPSGQICQNGFCRPCSADTQCPARHRCVKAACVSACTTNTDCPAQHQCTSGLCEAGIKCAKDSECTGGYLCKSGVCAVSQAGSCKIDKDCGKDQICKNGNCELSGSCNNKCSATEKCLQNKCVPLSCTSDGQCGQGFKCRNSQCIVLETNCGGKGPCPSGKECIQGRCVSQLGSVCVGDEECVPGLTCAKGSDKKRCSKICTSGSDCPDGFFCTELSGIGAGCWRSSADIVCPPTGTLCQFKGGCSLGGEPPIFEGLFCLFFFFVWFSIKRKMVEM